MSAVARPNTARARLHCVTRERPTLPTAVTYATALVLPSLVSVATVRVNVKVILRHDTITVRLSNTTITQYVVYNSVANSRPQESMRVGIEVDGDTRCGVK